jgi:hypothetical protein
MWAQGCGDEDASLVQDPGADVAEEPDALGDASDVSDAVDEPDVAPDVVDEPDVAPDVEDEPDVVDEPDLDPGLLGQPCDGDPERCSFEGLICAVRRDVEEESVEVTCQPLNEQRRELGEGCLLDRECQSGLCLEDWRAQLCSAPCLEDADCGQEGWRCEERALVPEGSEAAVVQVCVPPDPSGCASNEDCALGEVCGVVVDREGLSLVSVCTPQVGSGVLGRACAQNDECAAGLCLGGFCAVLCTDGQECTGADDRCEQEAWAQDGLEGSFSMCRTLPETECSLNADCEAQARVCGVILFEDPARLVCVDPVQDGLPAGSACEGRLSRNEACEERLCLTGFTNECTRPCAQNEDCADIGEGYTCSDFRFSGQVVRMCARGCASDAACPEDRDQTCTLHRDATEDRYEFLCREPSGEDAPGADWSQEVDCDHGICLIRRSQGEVVERVCTLPCASDVDCPVELPVCGTANILTPSGLEQQQIGVCTRN